MTNDDRLSGWKEIADHLKRSVRSVQRWEQDLGLPVQRVKTRSGQVVYASRAELDDWLINANPALTADKDDQVAEGGPEDPPEVALEEAPAPVTLDARRTSRLSWPVTAGLALVAASIALGYAALKRPTPDYHRSYVTIAGRYIEARHPDGTLLWKHDVGREISQVSRDFVGRVDRSTDSVADVDLNQDGMVDRIIPVRYGIGGHDPADSDGVMAFSADGRLLWSATPSMTFTCARETFRGPWRLSAIRVSDGPGPKRVWASYIHHTWWPSFVVEIALDGEQQLRYVQSGWIMSLTDWQRPDGHYVVAAGVLNAERSSSIALIDVNAPLTVTESTSGEFSCEFSGAAPEELTLFPHLEVPAAQGIAYLMGERVMRLGDDTIRLEWGATAWLPSIPAGRWCSLRTPTCTGKCTPS